MLHTHLVWGAVAQSVENWAGGQLGFLEIPKHCQGSLKHGTRAPTAENPCRGQIIQYDHVVVCVLKRVKAVIPCLRTEHRIWSKCCLIFGKPFFKIRCGDVGPPAELAFDVPLLALVTFQAEDVHCWEDFLYLGRCQGMACQRNQVPVAPELGPESGSVLQARWPFHMATSPSSPTEHFQILGKLPKKGRERKKPNKPEL